MEIRRDENAKMEVKKEKTGSCIPSQMDGVGNEAATVVSSAMFSFSLLYMMPLSIQPFFSPIPNTLGKVSLDVQVQVFMDCYFSSPSFQTEHE
jgi:hypothetical protein